MTRPLQMPEIVGALIPVAEESQACDFSARRRCRLSGVLRI